MKSSQLLRLIDKFSLFSYVRMSHCPIALRTDMDEVMNALEIIPRPRLVVTIFKSRVHVGSTPLQTTSPTSRDMFTNTCFVGERNREDLAVTEKRMALFLKEQLLPICIKTHALVFIHDSTCGLSAAFGSLCETERNKRDGDLPFTVMCLAGAHNICMVRFYLWSVLYITWVLLTKWTGILYCSARRAIYHQLLNESVAEVPDGNYRTTR